MGKSHPPFFFWLLQWEKKKAATPWPFVLFRQKVLPNETVSFNCSLHATMNMVQPIRGTPSLSPERVRRTQKNKRTKTKPKPRVHGDFMQRQHRWTPVFLPYKDNMNFCYHCLPFSPQTQLFSLSILKYSNLAIIKEWKLPFAERSHLICSLPLLWVLFSFCFSIFLL